MKAAPARPSTTYEAKDRALMPVAALGSLVLSAPDASEVGVELSLLLSLPLPPLLLSLLPLLSLPLSLPLSGVELGEEVVKVEVESPADSLVSLEGAEVEVL